MMTVLTVLYWIFVVVVCVLVVVGVWFTIYAYWLRDWFDYRRAKDEIFEYVKGYKHRCTGANRFVVTVEVLQDTFREYDTNIITEVWLELIKERLIQQDPQDNEWCMR